MLCVLILATSGEKWLKVAKSGEKFIKVYKSGEKWEKWGKVGKTANSFSSLSMHCTLQNMHYYLLMSDHAHWDAVAKRHTCVISLIRYFATVKV